MPERATVMNRSEKSAEAVVAASAGRRAEREGESTVMAGLGKARQDIRNPGNRGESRKEAMKPRLETAAMKHGLRVTKRKARDRICSRRC